MPLSMLTSQLAPPRKSGPPPLPPPCRTPVPVPLQNSRLAQQAYWCMKFAKANAVALRKILKKHDKVARNLRGRQFLQASQPRCLSCPAGQDLCGGGCQ